MKKRSGKRILAGFLAVLLVMTSFAWDFGGANVVKAEDASTAITKAEDSLNINFENIDITELDDTGYTSTRFESSEALVGEVNQKVSEQWFVGDGTDTPYGDADETTITGKNNGLKSNDIADSNTRSIMYTPCSYEDFTVSAEIYYGAFSGIVIGEKNVYPTESDDASSVAVFFNGGRIHIMGAVDRDSAKILRGSKAAIANNGDKAGYKIFNNGSGDTIKADAGSVYTLNVKKTGNHLIVWYSGGNGLMIIKLTEAYKTGAIGIQSRGYDGDCGGFKSLNIEKVHATETHNLDNADITELDNLGYSATFGGTVVNNSVGNAFFSGTSNSSGTLTSANEGLKGITTGTSVSGLNIPYIYENFRLEAEVYSGQLIGVAVGDASVAPRTSKMLSAFYNMNGGKIMLQMEGAYSGSWTRVGGAAGTNGTQWRPTLNGAAPTDVRDTVYTLVLEVRDGKATLWMEGHNGYVTATLADTYVTEKITLIARHSSNDKGGIKGYTITNLDAGDTQNFDNVELSNLDASGYTARADGSSTLASVSASGLWFSGDSTNYSASETYKNVGLKPSNTNTTREILNTPHTFENFRLKADVYHGQVLGVKIGAEEKGTQVGGGTVSSGSVSIYINGENLAICGAIDYATAQLNGAGTSLNKAGCIQYKPTGNSAKWNQARTLIIEVQDGILSVSFADLEHVLRVKLNSSYEADSIAFFARRYDTASGSAGGGLKGYTIEKLPSANTGTTVDIAGYTDFDHVDVSVLDAKNFTSTQFDTSNGYAIVGDADQNVGNHWFAGETRNYASDKLATSGNAGLKPYTSESSSRVTLLNTPYTYENFTLSTEVYWGGYTGIVIGEKNVYPVDGDTTNAFRVYFNANQIQLTGGGLEYSTATVQGGTGSWNAAYAPSYIFKPDSGYKAVKGEIYQLNIEVSNGILYVSMGGYDSVLTVALADTMTSTNVALTARQYDGDGGGLRSFQIEEVERELDNGTTVDVDGYTSFDHVDVSVLDEKNFTSTRFDRNNGYAIVGDADQNVGNHWFAGKAGNSSTGDAVASENIGLKPNASESSSVLTVLNTPYTAEAGYEDFRASVEVYWGAATGILLGEKNVYAKSDADSSIYIYFNANQIQLNGGGFDPESVKVSGGTGSWSPNYAPTYIFKPDADFTVTKGEVYDLNVELVDGVLTVWVEGYDTVLTLKTNKTYKQDNIALVSRQYDGDGGGLKSLTVEKLDDVVMSYSAEEFATYRTAGGYKAPEYKDYLFAGWFTDVACTAETAVSEATRTVDANKVYAKFVPSYILDVEAQISANLLDENTTDDGKGSIRFVTTVDSLDYKKIGFKLSYDQGKGMQTFTKTSTNVYKELLAITGEKYDPTEFCNASEYFKPCTVTNVPAKYYDMEFSATPFWITLDGTKVYADSVVKTIDEGINAAALKGKTALFLGDSIMYGAVDKGTNQKHYMAWAGRLARDYGMVTENVANSGWALTNKETSGRGQIVTQFDRTTTAEFDFVVLEGGVNDVLIMQDNAATAITWGTINQDANATFDDATIAGAMQDLIVTTQNKYPNATVVYIINHYFRATDQNMEKYVGMVKDACRVHDIAYIDLSDTDAYPTLEPLSYFNKTYIPDNLHPNAAGYDLSTPVVANGLKAILQGEWKDEVYVSSTGKDASGYGTQEQPYQTLNYAMEQVKDGGTVYVQGELVCSNANGTKFTLGDTSGVDKVGTNGKHVIIAGTDSSAKLDFSSEAFLMLNSAVTLRDIQVKWPTTRIYAEGNRFTVEESVVQTEDSSEVSIFAGSAYHDVTRTDLVLYAGTYKTIVGGQAKYTVGETHVTVGKNVNANVDTSSHDYTYKLFGGSYSEGAKAVVSGDTYVTVETGAKFNYVFGAGGVNTNATANSVVEGETHVDFAGDAYGVFGGGYGSAASGTHVKINGGTVYQVFGANEHASMTGNTDVQLLGGTVKRRVYGGCYNDSDSSWAEAFQVTGYTSVAIGPNVTFSFSDNDQGVFAGSRYKSGFEGEIGTVIFLDDCYSAKNSVLGSQDLAGSLVVGTPEYHYLVKASANGNVCAAGNSISVVPKEGYQATVKQGETTLSATEEGGEYYALPELGSAANMTIDITFTAMSN